MSPRSRTVALLLLLLRVSCSAQSESDPGPEQKARFQGTSLTSPSRPVVCGAFALLLRRLALCECARRAGRACRRVNIKMNTLCIGFPRKTLCRPAIEDQGRRRAARAVPCPAVPCPALPCRRRLAATENFNPPPAPLTRSSRTVKNGFSKSGRAPSKSVLAPQAWSSMECCHAGIARDSQCTHGGGSWLKGDS